jgi:hypothetical protein
MDFGLSLTLGVSALGFCVQVVFLWLQVGALRRHGEDSFRLLAAGSVCGVIYTCFIFLPYVVTFSTNTSAIIYAAGLLFLLPAYILSIVGTVLLFRSYRRLAERGNESPQPA